MMIFKRKRELLLCGTYLQLEAFFMTSTEGRVTFSNMSNKPPYFCWKRGYRKTTIVRGLPGERSLQKILAERHFCSIPKSLAPNISSLQLDDCILLDSDSCSFQVSD